MGTLLALASALCYGISDFTGGLLSRRAPYLTVALLGQLGALVVSGVLALLLPAHATPADLGWGALSGVGSAAGMLLLFRGLSRGAMSVVVPVSAVVGVVLPVLVGVALLGERPGPAGWCGVAVAVPALWLVSARGGGEDATPPAALLDALLASVGFAVQYLALARAGTASGAWPVVSGRVAAVLALLPLLLLARRFRAAPDAAAGRRRSRAAPDGTAGRRPRATVVGLAVGSGGLAAVALLCYLVATREQLMVLAVVLSSLYPAVPALLGLSVLHERVNRWQVVGLVAAAGSVVLTALG
jgi:drug/metabolite transporter (DMT)-like permease